jgi:hypothetical protein
MYSDKIMTGKKQQRLKQMLDFTFYTKVNKKCPKNVKYGNFIPENLKMKRAASDNFKYVTLTQLIRG